MINFEEAVVETLFKVELPLDTLENGYGYLGCILKHKKSGKIQCHICGKWFDNLSTHIQQTHKLKIENYKRKFGLPMGYGLVSEKLASIRSKTALKNMEFIVAYYL